MSNPMRYITALQVFVWLVCMSFFLCLSVLCLSLWHSRHLNFSHWISWQLLYEFTWHKMGRFCPFSLQFSRLTGGNAILNLSEIQMTGVLGTELTRIHVSTYNCVPPFFSLWTKQLLIWGHFGSEKRVKSAHNPEFTSLTCLGEGSSSHMVSFVV